MDERGVPRKVLKVSKDPNRRWMTNELWMLTLYVFIILFLVLSTPPDMWSFRAYLALGAISLLPAAMVFMELIRESTIDISDSGIKVETRTIERYFPFDDSLLFDIVLNKERPEAYPLEGVRIMRNWRVAPLEITPDQGWYPEDVRTVYEAVLPLIDEHGIRTTLLFKEFRSNRQGYVLYRNGNR